MTIKWIPKARSLYKVSTAKCYDKEKSKEVFWETIAVEINQWRVPAALDQYLTPQMYPSSYSLNNDDPEQPGVLFISPFHLC